MMQESAKLFRAGCGFGLAAQDSKRIERLFRGIASALSQEDPPYSRR